MDSVRFMVGDIIADRTGHRYLVIPQGSTGYPSVTERWSAVLWIERANRIPGQFIKVGEAQAVPETV